MLSRLRKVGLNFKNVKKTLRVGNFQVCPGANTGGCGGGELSPPPGRPEQARAATRRQSDLKAGAVDGGEEVLAKQGSWVMQANISCPPGVTLGCHLLTSSPLASYLSQGFVLSTRRRSKLM